MTRLGSRFRAAIANDAPAIAALVNAAYAGDGGTSGWTHETRFFDGERTDRDEILELLAAPQSLFLLRVDTGEIVGCAYLKMMRGAAYMGLLAVRPALQAAGVGKELIAECERIAHDQWQCRTMRISVITSHRPELTAFYQRRGFLRTGRFKIFDRKQARSGARVKGIGLEWMEKELEGIHA